MNDKYISITYKSNKAIVDTRSRSGTVTNYRNISSRSLRNIEALSYRPNYQATIMLFDTRSAIYIRRKEH